MGEPRSGSCRSDHPTSVAPPGLAGRSLSKDDGGGPASHTSNLNDMDPLRIAKGGIDLAAEIADALASSGEYVAQIELLPTQQLVDFHWAAHRAGRRLGVKVTIDVHVPKNAPDTRAQVRVTPSRHHGWR